MTILDMLNKMNENNKLMTKSLEIIKDNYTSLVNDNYELTLDENRELSVKIPSLERRNEYVYKSVAEYPYPLIMCMRILESSNVERYNYMLSKFMDLYRDKLDLLFKDVHIVDTLKAKIVKTKDRIDYVTYYSIATGAIGAVLLIIFNFTNNVKNAITIGIIVFFILALFMQITKESQVKKIVDAYISLIKTEWYQKELNKQYTYLCNFIE